MKKNLFALLGAVVIMLSFSSCGDQTPKGYKLSDTGVMYKFYSESPEGKTPALGDFVRVQMVYAYEDSIIFDTRGQKRDFEMKLEEPVFEGDIYSAVAMMKEGDSAGFLIDATEFFTKLAGRPGDPAPAFVNEGSYLTFNLKLTQVMTTEEHDSEIAQLIEKQKADEPIILGKYLEANNFTGAPQKSGLYFINIRDGKGPKPKNGDVLTINFKVMLMDGSVLYDSWEEEPVQFEFGKRFDTQGLVEGISMMKEGQMAHLIVPSNLAFGEYGRQGLIEPYSTLLYDVEILEIKDQEEIKKETIRQMAINKKESDAFLAKNATRDGVVVLPSGLQYKVLESGEGTVSPSASSRVKVHYTGTLIDGTKFDSSVDRGRPSEFGVNGVIAGWTEALQLMKEGDKWQLYIPSDLAYGENPRPGGPIGPNMALIFDVELLEIVQ